MNLNLRIFPNIDLIISRFRVLQGRFILKMNSARNNEEMNSMKVVDETMGEVRRNWNVMTQEDVNINFKSHDLIIH